MKYYYSDNRYITITTKSPSNETMAKKLMNKTIPVPNENFINQIEQCLNTYRQLMMQINFTKHPAELQLATEQVNQILLKHATSAHADVLDYLGKYITFDYISQWEKDELEDTQE